MKTNVLYAGIALSAFVLAAGARASTQPAASATSNEKHYTGTVLSVDRDSRVLRTRGLLVNSEFNLGDACAYAVQGKQTGAIEDLRPGQKVRVFYHNRRGVLVADRVVQQPMRFEGKVMALDQQQHTVTVRRRMLDRTFQLPSDCTILLRHDKSGTLADVQPGEWVTITYEEPQGKLTARQIAQTSETFTGTVKAIDLSEQTVKAKTILETKRFNLADGCTIVVNGKPGGQLRDLKLGDKITLNYDDSNGVNIADRIAALGPASETVTAQTSQ